MSRLLTRITFSFVVAFFIFLVYVHLPRRRPVRLTNPTHCPLVPPDPPYQPPAHDRFNWRNVAQKNPLKSYSTIARERPLPLPRIQHEFTRPGPERAATLRRRRAEVKRVFKKGWTAYKQRAWMQDELTPVTGASRNNWGGWGATLVDTLDTLWIMDMKVDFEQAVVAAATIDFDPYKGQIDNVNIFETTIRYLGGLLGAYDLTDCRDKRLLNKAVELGDMLYAAFDTFNRMPLLLWDARNTADGNDQLPFGKSYLAEIGSLSLEFTRLSQLTGDMRWFDAIQRITDLLDAQQNTTNIPGLWPVTCSPIEQVFNKNPAFSLGPMADSAYEYLPKMYALLGGIDPAPQYERMYTTAMQTAKERLFFRPITPDHADILISGQAFATARGDSTTDPETQHLTCFAGGMLALGGRLFPSNKDHIKMGRKLTDGCIWAYRNTPTGIMPERFHMAPCGGRFGAHSNTDGNDCTFDKDVWRDQYGDDFPAGFTGVTDTKYSLRPEAIESVFYLYRITGDERLQDAAWDMFQAIEQYTKTDLANAELKNVFSTNPITHADTMESFWTAETLKYFYLVFSDPGVISLDDFVFNTEAHPFRLPK